MAIARQSVPSRQAANRVVVGEIRSSVAFNQYTYSSQNASVGLMDEFMTGLNGAFSIGCWVKGRDLATIPAYVFGASPSAGGTYCLFGVNKDSSNLRKMNLQLRDDAGTQLGVQCSTPVLNGQWHLSVFTKDATNTPAGIKPYVNGSLASQTTISSGALGTTLVSNRAAMIGSSAGSASFFKGLVSQFGIWLRELSASEISNWYSSGVPPSNPYRLWIDSDDELTTTLTDSAGSGNGTLDSVNMWSDDSPRGLRKLI